MASHLNSENATAPIALAASARDQLCFIATQPGGGATMWSPPSVEGDWAAQCEVGRDLGQQAVDYIRQSDDAAILPSVVRAMVERGSFDGVEVGFFAAISMQLASSAN